MLGFFVPDKKNSFCLGKFHFFLEPITFKFVCWCYIWKKIYSSMGHGLILMALRSKVTNIQIAKSWYILISKPLIWNLFLLQNQKSEARWFIFCVLKGCYDDPPKNGPITMSLCPPTLILIKTSWGWAVPSSDQLGLATDLLLCS